MTSGDAFKLYNKPKARTSASKRKESRQYPGESSSDPSKKRARTEKPPTPVPSKEITPPPAPIDPTPPTSIDSTPLAPINPTPLDQSGKTQAEAVLNTAYNSANDKLKKLSSHRRSQEAFSNVSSMKVKQILSHSLNEILSGVLTLSIGWRHSEETSAKHAEEIKAIEGRLVEQLKAPEDRHAQLGEELRAAEEQSAKMGEELKQHNETLAKVTESKEKYREASVINFKEASKLQDELAISRKETTELEEQVKLLEETNASDFERFKDAAKLAIARLEEEETAQGSLEISLATGIEGIDEGADTTVDQQPQDPPATPAAS
ncbi:uncharacterized protein LOC133796115 [Humulus lupulus]|uniref:uncharacterized protein LOC133796115 n=1 Tax=Humulus lupulus TaxID=3486 RepID=UPI002B417436|nr:uncharacterized protein LOC133796115 [Humulus lupulus]